MPSTKLYDSRFDDIRPYTDDEFREAMKRLVESDAFALLCSYVYPGKELSELRKGILSFNTIRDFQTSVMAEVNRQVIARSTTSFDFLNLEKLSPSKKYLFVSNHRDIMLDASLMQYALNEHNFETAQITFGANLMSSQLLIDIGRSNKMFRVERGGKQRDFYMSSRHLSDYIRYIITEYGESVWIAQRNGRTKDGIDETDQGIIKMFGLSKTDDKIRSLSELNIMPVCVSYEWEPCDVLKALELYETRMSGKYVKKPGEDTNSILTGIIQQKGRVVFSLGDQITEEDLLQFDNLTRSEFNKHVAGLLDERIMSQYTFFPNNYIAHDILYGQEHYRDKYTQDEYNLFLKKMERLNEFDIQNPDLLKEIYLGIYANPLNNKNKKICQR